MKINTYIHTYIHTQMILVSLLCIQASMLSYPILLRWVKTPIEKQVPLVSMSIHSTYMHIPIYIPSITCTYLPPTYNRHPLIHTYMPTYIHNHNWQYSPLLVDILSSSPASIVIHCFALPSDINLG